MQGICNYIPVTNHASRVYNFVAILYLQFMVHVILFPMLNVSLFYISTLLLLLLLSSLSSSSSSSSSLVTGLFSPVRLLNQRWSPPLRLQASHCSTFRIMCDVPSTAVFCSESIECFPGTASKFFLKLLLLLLFLFLFLLLLLLLIIIIVFVVEGNRKLDWDHEHCTKGPGGLGKKMSMAKKIRGGAKERNVRGRSSLKLCGRAGHLKKRASLF